MKKLFFILGCLLLCTSCQATPKEPVQVLTIGKADFEHKMKQQDSFVFLVTRNQCEYCDQLLEMIDYTKEDYDLKIYHLVLRDDNVEDFNEDIDFLETYLTRPDQTPHYYYIEDGEEVSHQMGYTTLNPYRFWDWYETLELEK